MAYEIKFIGMDIYTQLAFDVICKDVSALAVSQKAQEFLCEMRPFSFTELSPFKQDITVLLALFHAEQFHERHELHVSDIEALCEAHRKEGSVFTCQELYEIQTLLHAAMQTSRFLASVKKDFLYHAQVQEQAERYCIPEKLYEKLRQLLRDPDTINENAVPVLRKLRRKLAEQNAARTNYADTLVKKDGKMYRQQSALREGRVVLPVATNFRGEIRAVTYGVSGSGRTIFVEPEELMYMNNAVMHIQARIMQEIHAVLSALSDLVREELPALIALYHVFVQTDIRMAVAEYGVRLGGVVLQEGNELRMLNIRHPLLGRHCVPTTLCLEKDIRMLIISGPNTGGKTVLLKTVGLLALMNQCGIPISASESSVFPYFDAVFISIGDEQSIQKGLSTYSARLQGLVYICTHAAKSSLVLIDELGSGTDHKEGAALSMAIIDYLVKKGSTVLITTHDGILKHYGYTKKICTKCCNGS